MTILFNPRVSTSAPFLGPGYGFTAKSTFGPVPGHTYLLDIQFIRIPTLQAVGHTQFTGYTPGDNWDGIWGVQDKPGVSVQLAQASGAQADDLEVRIEVDDLTSSTIFDGPTTFSGFGYDPTNAQYICTLFAGGSGSTGGFNQGDRDQLTAIHNATVRGAYSTTTTHVGLVDNGSITTLNLTRALRVTVTGFPPNVDRAAGTPQYFFDLGFFTMNVAQGWVKSQRLVFEFQMYEAPQALDSFGWTLTAGTTINVEELAPV